MTGRIAEFNQAVGHIFAELYSNFPLAVDINLEAVAEAMGVPPQYGDSHGAYVELGFKPVRDFGTLPSGTKTYALLTQTLTWLQSEGFITSEGDMATKGVRLTSRGLAAMSLMPDSVAGKERLGDKLKGAVKEAGTEAGRTAIADTVGLIIGAFARGLSNG